MTACSLASCVIGEESLRRNIMPLRRNFVLTHLDLTDNAPPGSNLCGRETTAYGACGQLSIAT